MIKWVCTTLTNVHVSCAGHPTRKAAEQSLACAERFGRVTRMIVKHVPANARTRFLRGR